MSYSIALQVYQADPTYGLFSIVEQTVWNYANGGTWSEANGTLTLTMGGSGTSGVIRFMSDQDEPEIFTVAVGVHNYERWCDIQTDLAPNQTALVINGEYYNNGPLSSEREQQLAEYSTTTTATDMPIEITYTVTEGNDLAANIVIG